MFGKKDKRKLNPLVAGRRLWRALPKQGAVFLLLAFFISFFLHFLSGQRLRGYRPTSYRTTANLPKNAIKVRVIPKKDKKAKEKTPPNPEVSEKILETPQVATEKPKDASYSGNVDHKAEKETRVSEKNKREKARDPGQKGNSSVTPGIVQAEPSKTPPKRDAKKHDVELKASEPSAPNLKDKAATLSKDGSVAIPKKEEKARNAYESFLPTGMNDLQGQMNAGYQDFLDEEIAEGDRIDINTTEYRFIGYFTNMRKAIELVWNYPIEASRQGLQGEVALEFAIGKDGKASGVKVIKSSGYEVLDRAIVDAIKLASPFAPLPEGFGRQKMLVTGSFRYVLSAYGSH